MLNETVFKNIQDAKKQILVVTKYWDIKKTQEIIGEAEEKYPDIVFGLGENRIESITTKNIPRNKMHFIGNIQSQKIAEIVKYCGTIHSLSSLKHAIKIENIGFPVSAFIQIKLDTNKDIGISEDTLEYFLQACSSFKNLKIIGISGMGSADISEFEKREEFRKLITLRDTHIPNRLISAGTSRDYEIALDEGINIVRVGQDSILTQKTL